MYEIPAPTPPGIWTPLRVELLRWLQSRAPSLAAAYEGAVGLVGNRSFPGRVHFIAHAVRDISDRLVFCLDPSLDGGRVEYHSHLDGISKHWQLLDDLVETSANSDGADSALIPLKAARMVDELVKEHRKSRERTGNFELLFRHLMAGDSAHAEMVKRVVSAFKQTHAYFKAHAHLTTELRTHNEVDLQKEFEAFEKALHSFVGGFFTGTREIDAIIEQANR